MWTNQLQMNPENSLLHCLTPPISLLWSGVMWISGVQAWVWRKVFRGVVLGSVHTRCPSTVFAGHQYAQTLFLTTHQRAKKVVSDSSGLVDFAIGLVILVLNMPNWQVLFFGEIQITEGL